MNQNFASWVFSPIEYNEDRPLLIDATDPDRSLTFSELQKKVRQLVAGLKAFGVQPGDCVCVNAFNDIAYSVLYLGVIGAGAIFTAVNPAYSVAELSHHMDMVTAKFLFVEPPMLQKTLKAAKSCRIATPNVLAFDVHEDLVYDGVKSWTNLLQYGESNFEVCSDPDTTVATYKTSSGTSGLPKVVRISHSYLMTQAKLRMNEEGIDYEIRRLIPLPPMHAFATPIIPASIRQGAPTYIMRRYEHSSFVRAIERHRITETFLAPPSVIGIPKCHLVTKEALATIRQIWFGGAAVSHENRLPLQRLLHEDARISASWGMTEAGWVTPTCYPEVQTSGSVGSPLEGYTVRVVDENGREKYDPRSEGELQILAPHPMLGYLNNDLANREVFHEDEKGRWINSGDIGYIDEGGQVFIVDRKKDLIKVRGWQVSPAEVESCIQGHPEVVDVGVIGIQLPDDSGEAVCAYVVRHCDSVLTAEELRSFTSSRLANFKCPRDIVFTENVPRNPTGKILRRLIRDQAVPAIPIASLTTSTWLLAAAAALAVSSCLVSKLATINVFLRWL